MLEKGAMSAESKTDAYVVDDARMELSPGGTKTVDVNMHGLIYGKKRKSKEGKEEEEEQEEYNVELPPGDFPRHFDRESKLQDTLDGMRKQYGLPESPLRSSSDDTERLEKEIRVRDAANMELAEELEATKRQLQRTETRLAAVQAGASASAADMENGADELDPRDKKIVDLAKRHRATTLSLNREKALRHKLQRDLDAAKEELQAAVAKGDKSPRRQPARSPQHGDFEDQKRELLKKLKQSEERSESLRRKSEAAAIENKKMRTVLVKEVGDGPELDGIIESLTSSSAASRQKPTWKGRAQQIVLLKSKLKRASEKLAEISGKEIRPKGVDGKAAESLRKLDKERKAAMERLLEEYNDLEGTFEETKRRYKASRARCTVLEQGNKKLKSQVKVVLKKTTTDDKFVDALKEELAHSRRKVSLLSEHLREAKEQIARTPVESEERATRLQEQSSQQIRQIQRLEQMLENHRAKIKELSKETRSLKKSKVARDFDEGEMVATMSILEEENVSLGDLNKELREKLRSANEGMASAQNELLKMQRNVIRLERKVASFQARKLPHSRSDSQSGSSGGELQTLRDDLAFQKAENKALQKSAQRSLEAKDAELDALGEMNARLKQSHRDAMDEVREKLRENFGEADTREISSSKSEELARENEYLRSEVLRLHEILDAMEMDA